MVQITTPQRTSARSRRQAYSLGQRIRASFYDVQSFIAITLLAIILLVNIGYNIARVGVGDLTNLVFSTLEYLDLQAFSLANDTAGRAILIFNILFYVLFAQSILDIIQAMVRRRPEARQVGLAQTLRNHVIVCGLGRIGYRIVTRLTASGYGVVVIDRNAESEFLNRVTALRVPVIQGDARDPLILQRAGVARACAVAACIDGDLTNLEIALAAREANKATPNRAIRVILRAFGEDFDQGFEHVFGASTAFSHSKLAAPTLAASALVRNLEHVLPVDGTLVGVTQVVLPQGQPLAAFTAQFPAIRAIATAQAGSDTRVTVLGDITDLAALHRAAGAELVGGDGTVIICGLGKVSYRAVRLLHAARRQAGSPRRIVVIHRDDSAFPPQDVHAVMDDAGRSFTKMIRDLPDVEIRLGDARDPDLLRQAGIATASAVLAITSDDQVNVQIGLEARSLNHDVHVVLRVFSDTLAVKLGDLFGIHTVYSTSDLASPTLAAAAVLENVSEAFFVNDTFFARRTVTVKPGFWLDGAVVGDILQTRGVAVLALQRTGAPVPLPPLEERLAPGDVVTIVAPLALLERLRQRA
jgi:Trk K+ transport system NAD-binding subunit